jgi:spermidine synthase
MNKNQKNWYIDNYLPNVQVWHQIKKVLFEKKTKFQTIQILDLYDCGKSLIIDGIPQSSVSDEWIYHECLVHPALLSQLADKKLEVLVLGAGEGATLREILKYKNVKKITTIDIDKEAVKIFKKYFPEMHQSSFTNPKIDLIIDSADNFLRNANKKYDIIYSDISDFSFFNLKSKMKKSELDFYKLVNQKLNRNGIFAMHTCDFSEVNYQGHLRLKRLLEKVFPYVYSYRAYVDFFGDYWGFLIASPNKKFKPLKISKQSLKRKLQGKKLKFLSPEMYKAIFTLPPFLNKIME